MTAHADPAPRWMPYVWLIFLGYLFVVPVMYGGGRLLWTATLVSIALFLPLYFGQFAGPRPLRLTATIAIAVLGFALMPINPGANTYVIFSAAGIPFALRPRGALVYLAVLVAGVCLVMIWLPPGGRYWIGMTTIVLAGGVGGMNVFQAERIRQHAALLRAHEDVEEMAKLAERERIARDLHDLLGHTLSVITLKSELASKLAESDPGRAMQEIRDVERVSRDALSEVRRAVEGYQQHGLHGQLQSAANVLTAAGVRLETHIAPVSLPARYETVLALALREAMTNIVRHAASTRCVVRLAADDRTIVLTVEDDGRGGPVVEGIGLSGMRGRVAELGGRVDIDGRNGLRLVVTLPAVPMTTAET
ncbi:MAG: sensor histidine kinase [Acidimicrobiia bacterium]|nr:sensor histidine kinase [Acidimicrobiia bacterium]